jgi:hypothetical protein
MSKAKLLVYVLSDLERGVNAHLCRNLLDIQSDRRFRTTIEINTRNWLVCHVRNRAMARLRDENFDWLLMVDSDQSFRMNPLTVLKAASPRQLVVGFPTMCSLLNPDAPELNVDPQSPSELDGSFVTVSMVGGGALAIRREVAKALPTGPWFQFEYDQADELRPMKASEDGFFVNRCWQSGVRVWIPTNVPLLPHWKRTDISFLGARVNELNLLKSEQAKGAVEP